MSKTAGSRLAAISTANQGLWLLTMVNGRIVDGVLIDKPVEDGLLVIWKGVTASEIRAFDKERPRIGQDPKEWKKQSKKS